MIYTIWKAANLASYIYLTKIIFWAGVVAEEHKRSIVPAAYSSFHYSGRGSGVLASGRQVITSGPDLISSVDWRHRTHLRTALETEARADAAAASIQGTRGCAARGWWRRLPTAVTGRAKVASLCVCFFFWIQETKQARGHRIYMYILI